MKLSANGVFVHLDYALAAVSNLKKEILIYSCFERSEISLRGFMANVGLENANLYQNTEDGTSKVIKFGKIETVNHYTKLMNGREPISHGVCVSKKINEQYILTTERDCELDIYNMLMTNFTLPLLPDWVPYLLKAGAEHLVKNEVQIYGRVPLELEGAVVYENLLDETILSELVSEGLRSKAICISPNPQRPLQFENMDDYFQKYGHSLVENLEKKLNPLVPLKDKVDEIAFLRKRFYPQQAAIVNGLMECLLHRKNAILNEDMGCGKTLQGMGVIEGFFNAWFLRQHKDKTIKDVYLNKDSVKYRNIIMCPSHLVEKWAESIREDIPYAKVTIIRNLKVLIKLRKQGKARTGKEFYIISKDTGKLSYSYIPIPTQEKMRPVKRMVCKDCDTVRRDYSVKECTCKSTLWKVEMVGFDKKGMICPDCGELLFPADIRELKFTEEGGTVPLQVTDFAVQTAANKNCRFCGATLWQPCCEPLESKYFFRRKTKRKSQKWIKMTHWANLAKKNKRTVWVFGKRADEYIAENGLKRSEINYPRVFGPRKFAPSRYISKFLRGYFDFAIFDEAHEFKGGGSAQGLAMHDLIKATDRQLALTGTIAGGYASHFFYLLYRLDPAAMKAKGYEYSAAGERRFVEKYGTIETEYEVGSSDGAYNTMSRGRMIGSPRCRPGISPLIYVDFLIDKAVFLNLSDMSHFLPPLHESVEFVELEKEIASEYDHVRKILKEKMRQGAGKTILGSFLQFSLSYSDKPYNRMPIRSPIDGAIIVNISDLSDLIADGKILNKERRLCEIINDELAENRNVFVYCEYTGDGESNVTHRLKTVIADNCKIRPDEVCILESSYPPAEQREQWMHEKAAEGVRVFITNPRCVKTGLDFLFRHKNVTYNFPTIINYQEGYDMFTIWQACRRHYRLNQTEECRTYFLVSIGTIQPDAVEMVASKQVATSAIQGQFSSEGLSAMARGVDPRIKLAQAVSEKSETQERGLKGMFDVLNKTNNAGKDNQQNYEPMLTFYELTGIPENESKGTMPGMVSTGLGENFDLFSMLKKGASKSDAADEKKSAVEVSELFGRISKQSAAKPVENALERVETENLLVQPVGELQKPKLLQSDVHQEEGKNEAPKPNDLFSAFYIGTVTIPKKSEVVPQTMESNALWASLAAGLTKTKEKKTKDKKKVGMVSIFKK